MDIIIPDNWLRDFLKTKATPREIAKYVSLCGPSFEKIEKKSGDYIYHIEITTNRIDSAGVYGLAKEINAILPRFKIKSSLILPRLISNQQFTQKVSYLETTVDSSLCLRFTAILIRNVQIKASPMWIKKRLERVGLRPINNVVDISNYVMHELGQPVHTFDYDKIANAKMILRKSKKGEELITLDGQKHILLGNDIVIEDGNKKLIDLCGIMGGKNSEVDKNTKNVLLFVQTYNPAHIRKTSMALATRSEAAGLFEKNLDPELVTLAIRKGVDLFTELTGGKAEKQILDIYPKKSKAKSIKLNKLFIDNRLGVNIPKSEINNILQSLGFKTSWSKDNLRVTIPTFRAHDMSIAEDVVEEIARLYGYHNIKGQLMTGKIPDSPYHSPFHFEKQVKKILKSLNAIEIYTLSLVPKSFVDNKALKLKNPLGLNSEYLRNSLMPSLVQAVKQNPGETESFHLFEIANVYLPKKNDLPVEKMMLAGIFSNIDFRTAKGIVESLLESLNIKTEMKAKDNGKFPPSQRLVISSGNQKLGQLGILKEGQTCYDFDVEALQKVHKPLKTFKPIPKYPTQIEDITLTLPERTRVGEVLHSIESLDKLIVKTELTDVFNDAHTFRVWYQHSDKTLTDEDVKTVRLQLIKVLKKKFGASF